MRPRLMLLTLVFLSLAGAPQSQTGGVPQQAAKVQQAEQTVFAAEALPGEALIKKPANIPDGALQILRDTLHRGTINCIKNVNGMTPDQIPASWFVASEIHLDGPDQADLIVQPNDSLPSPYPNRCLFGAHVVPFWVLGNTNGRYGLRLETVADGLKVLDSRTNWFRDIQTYSATIAARTTLLYKVSVYQYQLAEKKTEQN